MGKEKIGFLALCSGALRVCRASALSLPGERFEPVESAP